MLVNHPEVQVVKTLLRNLQSPRSLYTQQRSQNQRIHHPAAQAANTNLQMLMMMVNKNDWNSCHLLHTNLDQDPALQDEQMMDKANQDPKAEMVTQNIDIDLEVTHTQGLERAHILPGTGDPA